MSHNPPHNSGSDETNCQALYEQRSNRTSCGKPLLTDGGEPPGGEESQEAQSSTNTQVTSGDELSEGVSTADGETTQVERAKQLDSYYEFLGVDEDASTETIRRVARRKLAKHHPDRNGGDSESDEDMYIFYNRAQKVLTDEEQRIIYDKVGHDRYIELRETRGRINLSEDYYDEDDSESPTSSTTPQTVTSSSDDVSENIAATASDTDAYGTLLNIDEFGAIESLTRAFRRVWLGRIALFGLFIGVAALLQEWAASEPFQFWATLGWESANAESSILVSLLLVLTLLIGGTAVALNRYLDSTGHTPNPEEFIEEVAADGNDTGTKNVEEDLDRTATPGPDKGRQANTDLNLPGEEGETTYEYSLPSNNALQYGQLLFLIGIAGAAIGTAVGEVQPWDYFFATTIDGVGAADFWLPSSGLPEEMDVAINYLGSALIVSSATTGFLLVAYGLSFDVWRERYLLGGSRQPILWDTAIGACFIFILVGIVFAAEIIRGLVPIALPTELNQFLLVDGGELTGASLVIIGSVLMFGLLFYRFLSRALLSIVPDPTSVAETSADASPDD